MQGRVHRILLLKEKLVKIISKKKFSIKNFLSPSFALGQSFFALSLFSFASKNTKVKGSCHSYRRFLFKTFFLLRQQLLFLSTFLSQTNCAFPFLSPQIAFFCMQNVCFFLFFSSLQESCPLEQKFHSQDDSATFVERKLTLI